MEKDISLCVTLLILTPDQEVDNCLRNRAEMLRLIQSCDARRLIFSN
jgi:hypothetical protein